MPKVLVCDDDGIRVKNWAMQISSVLEQETWEVVPLEPERFAHIVRDLNERLLKAKSGVTSFEDEEDAATMLDDIDVLILDSDLTPDHINEEVESDSDEAVRTYLAGEMGSEVARLARAFTSVGAIVIVNQSVKVRTFDLTLVKERRELADVYVTVDDIASQGLWHGSTGDWYRPWAWPALSRLHEVYEKSIEDAELDTPVLNVIGLTDQQSDLISLKQLELLNADQSSVLSLTVRGVAMRSELGLGLGPKGTTSDVLLKRVGISAVRRWLERSVLPQQNVIVDLPHLLQSNPWLFGTREEFDTWNDVSDWWLSPEPPRLVPEAYNRPASALLGRNVWNVRKIPARPKSARISPKDPVFCEDISAFRLATEAKDFTSDIEGSYAGRFIADRDDVEYSPRHRLYT